MTSQGKWITLSRESHYIGNIDEAITIYSAIYVRDYDGVSEGKFGRKGPVGPNQLPLIYIVFAGSNRLHKMEWTFLTM